MRTALCCFIKEGGVVLFTYVRDKLSVSSLTAKKLFEHSFSESENKYKTGFLAIQEGTEILS
jgi:hypothetical protein